MTRFKSIGLAILMLALFLMLQTPTQARRSHVTKEENPMEAIIETNKGTMTAELYTSEAPQTTQNFVKLAQSGFYDGLIFHRVVPGFVIQTGDPTGTGSGGSSQTIPLEINPHLRHNAAGILGMARTADPNSATSQFYITLAPTPFLDDNYAVFGKLLSGEEVPAKIVQGDKVIKLTVQPMSTTSTTPTAPAEAVH